MVLYVWKYLSCYDPLMCCSVSVIWFLHPIVMYKRSKNSMPHEMTEHWTTALPKLALAYCVQWDTESPKTIPEPGCQGHTVCSGTPNHLKPYLNLVAQCVYERFLCTGDTHSYFRYSITTWASSVDVNLLYHKDVRSAIFCSLYDEKVSDSLQMETIWNKDGYSSTVDIWHHWGYDFAIIAAAKL